MEYRNDPDHRKRIKMDDIYIYLYVYVYSNFMKTIAIMKYRYNFEDTFSVKVEMQFVESDYSEKMIQTAPMLILGIL